MKAAIHCHQLAMINNQITPYEKASKFLITLHMEVPFGDMEITIGSFTKRSNGASTHCDPFRCFDTMPECDRQTPGHS